MEIFLNILYPVLLVVVIISMLALIIIVLLQSDKSGGLGILGGSSSQTGFGSRKADPIVRATQVLGVLFIVGSFTLAYMNSWFSSQKEEVDVNGGTSEVDIEEGLDTNLPDTNNEDAKQPSESDEKDKETDEEINSSSDEDENSSEIDSTNTGTEETSEEIESNNSSSENDENTSNNHTSSSEENE